MTTEKTTEKTTEETTRDILKNIRSLSFFENVDMKKLIRELYPNPGDSVTGYGFNDVRRKCSKIYHFFERKFNNMETKREEDKETFFSRIIQDLKEKGFEELAKVIEIMKGD